MFGEFGDGLEREPLVFVGNDLAVGRDQKGKLCGVGWTDATLATTDSMYTSPAATPLSAEPAPTGVAKVTTSFWSEAEMQDGVTTDVPAWADCLYQARAVGS